MGLAWYTAGISSVPLELEEKISLCYLGLVLAAGSFDPDRGIRFATFAVPVMQNKILQGLKREKKHFGVISLEQPPERRMEEHWPIWCRIRGIPSGIWKSSWISRMRLKGPGESCPERSFGCTRNCSRTRDWHRGNTGKGLGAANPWYQDG